MQSSEKITPFKLRQFFSRRYVLVALCLIGLPLAIYWQVWDFELLWDDDGDEMGHMKHPYIKEITLASFQQLVGKHFFAMYIPVSYFVWGNLNWLAGAIGASTASVFHLANVAVHIANGLLVFAIVHQFVQRKVAVLLGALLFLLHPIQVESVAWMSEFRGLLAAFFGLLALYFYMHNQASCDKFKEGRGLVAGKGRALTRKLKAQGWRRRVVDYLLGHLRARWKYLAAVALLALALLSKPSAATIVLFIFAINHLYYRCNLLDNLLQSAPFIAITFAAVIAAHKIQSSYGLNFSDYEIAHWQRPFVWFDSIVFYLAKIIYPYNLGASYALSPKFITQQWWFLPLAAVPPVLAVGLWFIRRRLPLLVLAAVLFVFGFLATSGLVSFAFQKYSLVADRYMYFAMVGIALAAAVLLEKAGKNCMAGAAAVLILLATLSAFRQIPIWHDAIKLWMHSRDFEARTSYATTNIAPVFYNKGISLALEGKLDEALWHFDDVLTHHPKGQKYEKKYTDLFFNRGVIMFKYQKYQLALDDFDQALAIDPENAAAQNARKQVLQSMR